MDEILRMLAVQAGVQFPEHGYKEGDRVRMVDAEGHGFEYTVDIVENGEVGTVTSTSRFLDLMPVFEVTFDSKREIEVEPGVIINRIPFSRSDFHRVVKIEE